MAQLEHLCPCELYAQPGETTAPPLVELQKDVYVEEQDALLSHQKCWVKCRICLSLCVRKCTANAHALACECVCMCFVAAFPGLSRKYAVIVRQAGKMHNLC
eukprot:scaffold124925_cov21-Tisochrysis_lutea.AAC.3